MNRFDWNGLRRGDRVVVARTSSQDPGEHRGTVRFVTVRGRIGNDIGVKLDAPDDRVVWPTWTSVERDLPAPAPMT